MKHSFSLSTQRLAAGLCFALLAGCANLEPQVDDTRFYTLTSTADVRTGQQPPDFKHALIRVSLAADYLAQPAIAVRRSPQEIQFQEGHRWAERLDHDFARVVARGIESRQSALIVAPMNEASFGQADVVIEIVLVACEGTADGAAVLQANWRVFPPDESVPAAAGRFHQRSEGWTNRDFGDLAARLSSLADELAGAIATAAAAAADTG